MAAIQATAFRDGDHYVLNGQKTWASRGAFGHWLFGMFRTDPESQRHRGLSFVLAPLDAEGVTVRPIEKLNGKKAFAEVFFDNARVPVENLLGEEGKGWSVAMATAGFERGLMLRSPARFQNTARKLVELYRENADACDPSLREAVVDCWMGAEAYTLDTYRTVSRMLEGGKIGAEASLNKIFWSELDVKMHETALRILGDRAELLSGAPAAEGAGDWLDGFLFAISGPIYAGTNEIQRNVIAERLLGLPRS
jgi:alkylation response protein AidB-like acyl-CoA dehydrogenase